VLAERQIEEILHAPRDDAIPLGREGLVVGEDAPDLEGAVVDAHRAADAVDAVEEPVVEDLAEDDDERPRASSSRVQAPPCRNGRANIAKKSPFAKRALGGPHGQAGSILPPGASPATRTRARNVPVCRTASPLPESSRYAG